MYLRKSASPVPAARSEGLLVESVGEETVVYDIKTKEAHCLKPLAAFVFANADGKTSSEEMSDRASQALGQPVNAGEINDAIAQLRECELFDEPLLVLDGNGTSRREAIKRFAY